MGGGGTGPFKVTAATRVPLENGTDPSRANDFEAIAVGTRVETPGYRPVVPGGDEGVLRYQRGVWSLDAPSTRQLARAGLRARVTSLVFSAPDDGWAVELTSNIVYHFDGPRPEDGGSGHGWISCSAQPALCGEDPAQPRLSPNQHPRFAVAGERVYLYGSRPTATGSQSVSTVAQPTPVIIYHDHGAGQRWTDGGPGGAGFDPGCRSRDATGACLGSAAAADQGLVESLAVARRGDGGYCGWATGYFGASSRGANSQRTPGSSTGWLLRLRADGGWHPWTRVDDAAADYLSDPVLDSQTDIPTVTQAGSGCDGASFVGPGSQVGGPRGSFPILTFVAARQRWEVLGAPPALARQGDNSGTEARLQAMTSDGASGLWIAAARSDSNVYRHTYFYHYTARVHRPVFADVAHPVGEEITSATGAPDGSFWVTTNSSIVYRHDRLTGWERMRVPGWDPGSVVTAASEATAVAIGPDGRGVVVGKGGRIADVGPGSAVLDPVAGVACAAGASADCGTTRELRSAAVAPDGSVLVGGDARTLLWRPAGGTFQPVARPPAASSARISAISFPTPDRAWLTTDRGDVFVGSRSGASWSWVLEDLNADGDVVTLGTDGHALALHDVAIDGAGHGYAVGDRGLVLERTTEGAHPWRRLASGFLENFHSVALAPGVAGAGLLGAENGLIVTIIGGRLDVARPADDFDPLTFGFFDQTGGRVLGVGVVAGARPGQVEAWAAQQVTGDPRNRAPAPQSILHYSSDPSELLLSPDHQVRPLTQTPASRPGELRLAAFGKSECRAITPCPEMSGSTLANEQVARRVVDELVGGGATTPALALFTGDVNDNAGQGTAGGAAGVKSETDSSFSHHRWTELIAQRLADTHLPLFGAIGGQDLSASHACGPGISGVCAGTAGQRAGSNLAWRQAFAGMPAPWGSGDPPAGASVKIDPLTPSSPSTSTINPADGSSASVPTGGANTHYAFDVERNGAKVARVVFVDSSLRTLSGTGAQSPSEEQLSWLDKTLSSRESGEQAIVVSETPSYSYGPGATSDTLTDSASVEQILLKDHVNLVVSGRLGVNALYWTTAAGLHSPCAGDDYPDPSQPPVAGSAPRCAAVAGAPGVDAASQLAGALSTTAAPAPPAGCTGSGDNSTGVLPTVVASTAGGKFGPDGQAA
ncbi:MAG TPA: hypothetical protein VGN69_00360, partial [Solirubrobacteraceae bacterium]|nr:hypothetical protein [Solirubrobacteraceae bacterium]